MSPTFEANQRHQVPIEITATTSLNNQMVPMTVQHTPQQQSDLPILPPGLIFNSAHAAAATIARGPPGAISEYYD
jgi:D-alanyl-D-alanine carboxypeptidase